MVATGQLQQLQGEIGVLRGQLDASPGLHDELQRARDETKALNRALEAAAAERDRDVAAVQTNLSAATKDLEQWRQTANKYQQQIKDLERDVQQQSIQWQKTAEIQGSAAAMLQNRLIIFVHLLWFHSLKLQKDKWKQKHCFTDQVWMCQN